MHHTDIDKLLAVRDLIVIVRSIYWSDFVILIKPLALELHPVGRGPRWVVHSVGSLLVHY